MRLLLRFGSSLLCVLAAPASLLLVRAQDEPPAFGVTSRLVEVSVVALDKKGSPVSGLRKEQFTGGSIRLGQALMVSTAAKSNCNATVNAAAGGHFEQPIRAAAQRRAQMSVVL